MTDRCIHSEALRCRLCGGHDDELSRAHFVAMVVVVGWGFGCSMPGVELPSPWKGGDLER